MQSKRHHIYSLFIALVLSLLSCSSGNSPGGKVEEYYKLLNAGEYSKAKEFYTTEARQAVEKSSESYMKFANEETKQGTIGSVKLIHSIVRGEGATVNYAIVYKDDSVVFKSVQLTIESGTWKMGLIPPPLGTSSYTPGSNSPASNQTSSSNTTPPQSGGNALTTERAQGAVDSAMSGIRKRLGNLITPTARATVQGVQEVPNGAQADVRFIDTEAISESCRMKETWNTGVATFRRYTDGRWVLGQIKINGLLCESVWTFDAEIQ